jgi:hypothetical protein
MQIKLKSTSWAVALCAATIAFASNTQAAPLSNFRVIDAPTRVSPGNGGNTQPIQKPGSAASVAPQRHGADDPPGHDANDDRGRGRHRGRGR